MLNFLRREKKINFKHRGENVLIGANFVYSNESNISIGDNTSIGMNCIMFATKAEINIGRYVMFGPNVSVITGDHRIDLIGEYMRNVTNDMKLPENDKPVTIMDDVWVGINAVITKGVTIGEGSIIAAGAIVLTDVSPYTIYISKDKQIPRFTDEQILEHKKLLMQKYGGKENKVR